MAIPKGRFLKVRQVLICECGYEMTRADELDVVYCYNPVCEFTGQRLEAPTTRSYFLSADDPKPEEDVKPNVPGGVVPTAYVSPEEAGAKAAAGMLHVVKFKT